MHLPSGFTWRALKNSVTSPTPETDTPGSARTPGPLQDGTARKSQGAKGL